MANPQIENGYTAVANEILDNLYKLSLNGTELKVISCIFRYTFGFHRKSHKLSASFIARWGNCDLRAVKRALKKLQRDRIIICINSEQRGVVNKAGNVIKIYVDSVLFGAELVKYTEE